MKRPGVCTLKVDLFLTEITFDIYFWTVYLYEIAREHKKSSKFGELFVETNSLIKSRCIRVYLLVFRQFFVDGWIFFSLLSKTNNIALALAITITVTNLNSKIWNDCERLFGWVVYSDIFWFVRFVSKHISFYFWYWIILICYFYPCYLPNAHFRHTDTYINNKTYSNKRNKEKTKKWVACGNVNKKRNYQRKSRPSMHHNSRASNESEHK